MRSYFTKKRSSQDGKRSSLFGFLNKKPVTIPARPTLDVLAIPDVPRSTGTPITFKVAAHDANEFNWYGPKGEVDAFRALTQIWRPTGCYVRELLQSSFRPTSSFSSNDGGFANTVLLAYNRHHHLIIRPDDIWIAILAQLNLYVNANAEDLRSKFVAHEGKKKLEVRRTGSRYSVDFGGVAEEFGTLLKANILDPSLHEWIIPNYTTTNLHDRVICSVMMMSTLKA
ncbi:hypothetical protein CPB86DRAFT_566768 [Serendipita vermifera]|nr:hypothetical protein CPB86DRAFT_566768 [Serendipita vermifera]